MTTMRVEHCVDRASFPAPDKMFCVCRKVVARLQIVVKVKVKRERKREEREKDEESKRER